MAKLVAICLKGRAPLGGRNCSQVQGRVKGKIREWEKMNMKLNEKFLSCNYMQNLHKRLHNFRQNESIDEYMKAFHQLVARVELN